MPSELDKDKLLGRLERVKHEPYQGQEQSMTRQMSMSAALRWLLKLTHEGEYEVCEAAAKQVLGELPHFDDVAIDDDELTDQATDHDSSPDGKRGGSGRKPSDRK